MQTLPGKGTEGMTAGYMAEERHDEPDAEALLAMIAESEPGRMWRFRRGEDKPAAYLLVITKEDYDAA